MPIHSFTLFPCQHNVEFMSSTSASKFTVLDDELNISVTDERREGGSDKATLFQNFFALLNAGRSQVLSSSWGKMIK